VQVEQRRVALVAEGDPVGVVDDDDELLLRPLGYPVVAPFQNAAANGIGNGIQMMRCMPASFVGRDSGRGAPSPARRRRPYST
jgi:hypothetical protein